MQHTNSETSQIAQAINMLALQEGISTAEILKRLEGIDKKLETRIAYWKTQDAIKAFREHAVNKLACPENHDHWTREFELLFKDKNIAEISSMEIEGFLFAGWGDCERSTWNTTKAKVSGFFSYAIKELKRKGSPSFHNPCSLIDDMKNVKRKKHEFVRVDKMKELLDTFTKPSHWLWFHILATTGLRISELTELRPMDVSGRVLTLGGGNPCKSGRPFGEEHAVIPQVVADKLRAYMNGMKDDERIFKTTHENVWDILNRRCKVLKIDHLSPHRLRSWIATYYERKQDFGMLRFVLRHFSVKDGEGNILISPLTGRYVLPLSAADACDSQDKTLVKELFEEGR